MNYLAIDTEYTNFYSPDKVRSGELLQVAIVPVIDGVPDKDNAFNEYCKPITRVWSDGAENVHKISYKRAMTFQEPSELCRKLGEWIAKYDKFFVPMGYNCSGDKNYIERLLMDNNTANDWHFKVDHKWIDVKKLVDKHKKSIPKKKHRLIDMCEYFGIELDAHDALSDALATFHVRDRLKIMETPTEARQSYMLSKMTEVEKRRKYLDIKYLMLNGEGSIFITEHATKDKEALRIILGEIWSLYVENKESN